jgi:pimeloyl-ACP methyl ester carboxylesterase
MRDARVALPDGRELAYTDVGEPGGRCVIFCHGAPMSRLHLVPLEERFRAAGLRVVSADRPGYGGSSPRPGRTMADWPRDVAALADALGIERFLVAGHSSGGGYAVACAALLGPRVLGGVVVAGVTDMAWPGAWAGYLEGRPEVALMRGADEAQVLARCVERFGADGSGFFGEPFDLPEPDLASLADPAAEQALTAALTEAFRGGVGGYAQDVFLEGRGWPFDPGRIAVPMEILHGERDTLVPLAHSRRTAEVIPGARLRTMPGHGHLTIVAELPETAARLAATAWR